MVKLTAELIEQAAQYTSAVRDRELDLRGEKPPWGCSACRGRARSRSTLVGPGSPRKALSGRDGGRRGSNFTKKRLWNVSEQGRKLRGFRARFKGSSG